MESVLTDVDPAVSAFIAKHELGPAVNATVRLTREHFPGLRELTVEHAVDPEIPDCEYLSFRATVTGDVDQLVEQESAFNRAFCEEVSPDDDQHIVLNLLVVE